MEDLILLEEFIKEALLDEAKKKKKNKKRKEKLHKENHQRVVFLLKQKLL